MTSGFADGPRQTLAQATPWIEGIGLHTGLPAAVRVLPAEPMSGVRFRIAETGREIPASFAYVEESARCTLLRCEGFTLQTVEHLLSALAGLGVDDAVVETQGAEMPALDGSAAPFVHSLLAAGIAVQQDTRRDFLTLARPITLSGDNGSVLMAAPAPIFQAAVVLEYPRHTYLGTLAATFHAGTGYYAEDIAPARTYGFRSEVEALQKHGLALGASEDNAVVLGETGYETHLRFANELARHKLLDLIGDLSLAGRPLQAHVLAVKPSHALNARFAKLLAEETA